MHFSRKANILTTAFGLTLVMSAPAFPRDEIKLTGTVYLDEEACAKGTASADCGLNFAITGKAAKALYDGMTEKGAMQECTGDVEKFNESGMHCVKGETEAGYFCDFAYGFKDKSFRGGGDGC